VYTRQTDREAWPWPARWYWWADALLLVLVGWRPIADNWWADTPLLILVFWRPIADIGGSTYLCGKTMFEMIHWWHWYMSVICIVDKYVRFWKAQTANVPKFWYFLCLGEIRLWVQLNRHELPYLLFHDWSLWLLSKCHLSKEKVTLRVRDQLRLTDMGSWVRCQIDLDNK